LPAASLGPSGWASRPSSASNRKHHMLKTAVIAALALACVTLPAQARHRHHHAPRAVSGEVVAHPSGCPSRAFCGCGAAVRIFGNAMRHELWRAASWFRFPRAAPAPGMAAVKRHHVFVLERPIRGDVWLVWDANSGRHLTRVHPRSIAGYQIVNPHGGLS
jgi:hypothetical protein